MSRRASVDLPQPDSPTMPSVSPLSTTNDTSSTACTLPIFRLNRPPRMGKCFLRSRDDQHRLGRAAAVARIAGGVCGVACVLGHRAVAHACTSMAWRSPSLTRLKDSEVMKIASPGSAQT